MIEKWDWITGINLEYWNISLPIHSIVVSKPSLKEKGNGLIYTVDNKREGPWMITAHRLFGGMEARKTELGTLRKCPQPLTSLKVFDNGRVIVATSGAYLMFGTTEMPDTSPLKDVTYTWREIECPEWITSCDIQIKHPDVALKKAKPAKSFYGALNVVLGGLKGSIFIYHDLLTTIKEAERRPGANKGSDVISHRKHWHRNAVLSVKWSADGMCRIINL